MEEECVFTFVRFGNYFNLILSYSINMKKLNPPHSRKKDHKFEGAYEVTSIPFICMRSVTRFYQALMEYTTKCL